MVSPRTAVPPSHPHPVVLNAHANSQSHGSAALLGLISTLSSARVKWKVMESVCVNLAFSHSASRPVLVICSDFNNPCQTPNSSLHSALRLRCCVQSMPLSLTE